MSADSLDQRAPTDDPSDGRESAYQVDVAQRRLEALAEEIGRVIEGAPREEHEALRDYAVSLIRNRAQGSEFEAGGSGDLDEDEGLSDAPESSSNAATLIGYGVLLVPAGGLLALVLPPIGLMLGLTAVVMIATGIAVAVISRVRSLLTNSGSETDAR